jgi:hypothetical protein
VEERRYPELQPIKQEDKTGNAELQLPAFPLLGIVGMPAQLAIHEPEGVLQLPAKQETLRFPLMRVKFEAQARVQDRPEPRLEEGQVFLICPVWIG